MKSENEVVNRDKKFARARVLFYERESLYGLLGVCSVFARFARDKSCSNKSLLATSPVLTQEFARFARCLLGFCSVRSVLARGEFARTRAMF